MRLRHAKNPDLDMSRPCNVSIERHCNAPDVSFSMPVRSTFANGCETPIILDSSEKVSCDADDGLGGDECRNPPPHLKLSDSHHQLRLIRANDGFLLLSTILLERTFCYEALVGSELHCVNNSNTRQLLKHTDKYTYQPREITSSACWKH